MSDETEAIAEWWDDDAEWPEGIDPACDLNENLIVAFKAGRASIDDRAVRREVLRQLPCYSALAGGTTELECAKDARRVPCPRCAKLRELKKRQGDSDDS